MSGIELTEIYKRRFHSSSVSGAVKSRNNAWKALYSKKLKHYIQDSMTVMDLGSGPGYFSNQVKSKRVIAVDLDMENKYHLNSNVEFHCTSSDDLKFAGNETIDIVFSSNLFEHLGSRENLFKTLDEIRRVMSTNIDARLIILMPNIRYAKWDFFNFIDHNLPLNEKSLKEALELKNFEVVEAYKRFFPYSATNIQISVPRSIVKIYLSIKPSLRPFAKQMFFVARIANHK
jgi:hypothetical protein